MATPMKSANTIDFARARQQRDGNNEPFDAPDAELDEQRYRLLTQLQTTLELDQLLDLFYQELQSRLQLSGLRYVNEARQLQRLVGKSASHSCGYRLITRQGDFGELVVYRGKRFGEDELSTIEFLISTLLYPLRNALHYHDALQSAITDPLTGAGNRIALDTALEREICLARRHQQPLSLLVIDIDKFKRINDEHGHSAGDEVLKTLVALLKTVHRSTDTCFRFGGEEFVVILNRTDGKGAEIIAERLRHAVEISPVSYQEHSLNITVSIGIASYCETDTQDSLFNRADKALYAIKQIGGNQVTHL